MKKVFILIFSCILLQSSYAQVSGKIINKDALGVAGANVQLLNVNDSNLIKATITDNDGNYQFEQIAPGNYSAKVSAATYEPLIIPTFSIVELQQKDLGTQVLVNKTKDLQEITVRTQKPLVQQTAEGVVINPVTSVLTKGSNALQVLERSPGIVVNKRDNSIEMNGKSGVMVMLNGKPIRMSESQLLDLLAGMNGDDITSIELLITPGAKYDAEGSAGIINIVLKKNRLRGTSGNTTASAGYALRSKATAGFNLAHNTADINLYSTYSFSHNTAYSSMYVDSWQQMSFLGGSIHAVGIDTTYVTQNNHNATVGIDAKLDSKTSVGASVIYGNSHSFGSTNTHLGYNVLPDSLLQYNGRNSGSGSWNNVVGSIYAGRLLKSTSKLSLNADYLHFSNNRPYEVNGTFVNKHGDNAGNGQALAAPAQKGFAKTNISVMVGKADYSSELSKNKKLEAGIKSTFTQSSSYSGFESLVNGTWTTDPQAVNNIKMNEAIAAAYLSFNTQLNPSTNLTAGLRYEYSYSNMNDPKTGQKIVNRKLSSLFPSLFFTKKINDNGELQFSYTKRIARPSYNDLASYLGYSDPTAVITGNPFLQPTITHNIRLGYQYKTYSASLLFSRDINAIARWQLLESPQHDMLFVTPQNISWQNNITLQTNLPFTINNWWTMSYSFTGGLRQYKVTYSKQPFINKYVGYSFTYSQQFKLPRKFLLELSGGYNNRVFNGTQKVEGIVRVNTGIKKELKNNLGSLQLSVTDILGREKYDIRYGSVTREAFDIQNNVVVNTETTRFPLIRLAYSRSFGGNKNSTVRKAGVGDEQERIRKE